MKKYRNEWKYYCNDLELSLLNSRLKEVLYLDSNSAMNGKYYVHSLYFDDYKNLCARDTDAGISKRFKWRIRYYNNEINNLKLEKKEKLYGRCHKKTTHLSINEFNCIIKGDVTDIFWNTDEELIKEFCLDIMCKHFTPKVIIDYERIAYIENISNVRITLDTNISSAYEFSRFLIGDYINFPLQCKGEHILEVKFDDILPSYIKNIVCSYGFRQTSFSKYNVGRNILREVIK
jgi:hypothetical protein